MTSKLGFAALLTLLPFHCISDAAEPELKYGVIVVRHGVRSPTWDAARLNAYSAQPWPGWGVAPGELTPHGFQLMEILGRYYGDWLQTRGLLAGQNCGHVYIHADTAQRTLESARALSESLIAGCKIPVHSLAAGEQDSLFDPVSTGMSVADPMKASAALHERLGDGAALMDRSRDAFRELQAILTGSSEPKHPVVAAGDTIGVQTTSKGADLSGPLSLGSTLSEDFLLEYANGFSGDRLGWGRLTEGKLMDVLRLHGEYATLTRETPYLARKRGWNLLSHIVGSMNQALSGKANPDALGPVDSKLLLIAGHDTNLSNLAGMLNLEWQAGGYQKNETPPGSALIFLLLRDEKGGYRVRVQFIAQTPDQLREAAVLDAGHPPAMADVAVPGCAASGCGWSAFERIARSVMAEGR